MFMAPIPDWIKMRFSAGVFPLFPAHEALDEIDALYIQLTDIARGIKEVHI